MYFKNAVLIATLLQINVFIEITYVVCVICINISQLKILVTLNTASYIMAISIYNNSFAIMFL